MFFLLIPFILGSFIYKVFFKRSRKTISNEHVLITGGSSGIGKSLAQLCIQEGANVTIVARNIDNLNKAVEDLEQYRINSNQKIHSESIDVSNNDAVIQKFGEIEKKMGPIFMLANCAGLAICGKTEDISEADVKTMLNTNYLGTLYPIQAILKNLKDRQRGVIVITSSQAGLLGIFGLSIYASTKFALRGLAESLDMEVKPYNISVTLALPPDTDTPGLANENKSKPIETKLISGSAGLFDSKAVARKILDDALVSKTIKTKIFMNEPCYFTERKIYELDWI